MFIKSNPKAFPHVIRYLLLIYDPIEFRKKFTWPLYNKETEARFRYVQQYLYLIVTVIHFNILFWSW